MILKQIRISRSLSQDQLAQMSGLNVRTIQRIESGHTASLESLKCLAAALDIEVSTLKQEKFMVDKSSENWGKLSIWVKLWFMTNFLDNKPIQRAVARRVMMASHISGFLGCLGGLFSEAALVGGLIMLANAYLFQLLTWQGDKYGIWYDDLKMGT